MIETLISIGLVVILLAGLLVFMHGIIRGIERER